MSTAFFSFYFSDDVARAGQVRNMGVVDGDQVVDDQSWEKVKKGGDAAIETWIKNQMKGCNVVIVLVGANTASRKWVNYEIRYAWDNHWPIFGIRIHGLKDLSGMTSSAGADPFQGISMQGGGTLSQYVPLHTPSGIDSKAVYADIKAKMSGWIKSAPKRTK
jgi:antiphage defense system Thoeris ThsB-like protein